MSDAPTHPLQTGRLALPADRGGIKRLVAELAPLVVHFLRTREVVVARAQYGLSNFDLSLCLGEAWAFIVVRLRSSVTVSSIGRGMRRETVTKSTMITRTAAGLVFLFAMPAMAQNSMENMSGTNNAMAAPATHATSPSATEEVRETPATEAQEHKAMAAKHHARKHHRRHHRHHTAAVKTMSAPAKAM